MISPTRAGLPGRARRALAGVLAAIVVPAIALTAVFDRDARAEPPTITEPQLKAAFILNFARYVEWPSAAFASKDSPVVACALARDSVAVALAELESRPVQGRALKPRRANGAEDLKGCHVVFIGESDDRRVVLALRATAGQPTLTVGDSDRFVDLGGAIGIVHGEDRLQFEISRSALERANLKASAYLLRLARNLP